MKNGRSQTLPYVLESKWWRGIEPDLRIANGKMGLLADHQEFAISAKNSNKNAAAKKISTATNYDLQIPIFTNFGNGLATGKIVNESALSWWKPSGH